MPTITEQAIRLSLAEKLELISTLWDDVAQNPLLIPVPEWQRAELEKRIQSQRTNPEVGQSWDDVGCTTALVRNKPRIALITQIRKNAFKFSPSVRSVLSVVK